jgi:drug/metabolite transporter (DMT)-like permease
MVPKWIVATLVAMCICTILVWCWQASNLKKEKVSRIKAFIHIWVAPTFFVGITLFFFRQIQDPFYYLLSIAFCSLCTLSSAIVYKMTKSKKGERK